MKRRLLLTAGLAGLEAAVAQVDSLPKRPGSSAEAPDVKLPNGKSQRDEILKVDHERTIEDLRTLARMTEEMRSEVEKSDRFVLSVGVLRKLDEAEKLLKRVRTRIKRY